MFFGSYDTSVVSLLPSSSKESRNEIASEASSPGLVKRRVPLDDDIREERR